MSLIYKTGDILKATENIICHQVNVQGVMGGGLALQIARTYPEVKRKYEKLCYDFKYDYERLKGKSYSVKINEKQVICNCFTQKPNFDTDYNSIKYCFKKILKECRQNNKTIAVPYKYGSGIANGNWEEIETILKVLSGIYGVDINIYKLEEKNERIK